MPYKAGKCLVSELRLAKGWTQAQLSEQTMIPPDRISRYENKKKAMLLETAMTIAEALGTDVKSLYEWDYYPPEGASKQKLARDE